MKDYHHYYHYYPRMHGLSILAHLTRFHEVVGSHVIPTYSKTTLRQMNVLFL